MLYPLSYEGRTWRRSTSVAAGAEARRPNPFCGPGRCLRNMRRSRPSSEAVVPMIRDVLASALRAALADVGVEPPADDRPRAAGAARARRLVVERRPGHRPRRPGATRASSPPSSSTRLDAATRRPTSSGSRSPGPGFVNFHLAPTWLHDVLRRRRRRGRATTTPGSTSAPASGCRSSSSRPTRPGRSTSATAGSPPTATRSAGCSSAAATTSAASTTSTTPAGRSAGWASRCSPAGRARPSPRAATRAASSRAWPSAYDGPDDVTEAGRWAAERILGFIQRPDGRRSTSTTTSGSARRRSRTARPWPRRSRSSQEKGLVWEEDGALWLEHRGLRRPPREAGAAQVPRPGRRLHLPGRRPRLPPQQVPGPRLRPGHQRVGRRPPGPGRQPAGRRRGARRRARTGSRSASARWCRSPAAASASGSATPSTSTTWSTTSAPTSCGCCRWSPRSTRRRPSTSTRCAASRGSRPSSTCSTPTPASTRSAGRPSERGVERAADLAAVDLSLLVHERELELLRTLSELPEVVELACNDRAPHKVTDLGARAGRPVPRLLPRLLRPR